MIDFNSIENQKIKQKVLARKKDLSDKTGGDSVLTLFLTIDMDKRYFENIFTGHFFYTPLKKGLSELNLDDLKNKSSGTYNNSYTMDKESIIKWVRQYYELTTYEISCPVIRDASLAPEGKTGLIISTLMEYSLVRHISKMGWYDEFKMISKDCIYKYPGYRQFSQV